jgi:hypothetical protein
MQQEFLSQYRYVELMFLVGSFEIYSSEKEYPCMRHRLVIFKIISAAISGCL